MLDTLDRWADRLIRLCALVGTIGLITEVVVILVDVIGRYFGAPLRGAQDISTMTMVLVVFGGIRFIAHRELPVRDRESLAVAKSVPAF